jgi:hypothetical protein
MTSRDLTFAAAGASGGPEYVDDVFSTFLFETTDVDVTINNGIDLAGKGGLVWNKSRSNAYTHELYDTVRGGANSLRSNSTDSQANSTRYQINFANNGFTWKESGGWGSSNFCSWAFREAPKFFDVVTYTGNGTNRTIAHNLGSVPGMIIVKRTDTTGAWQVYHRSLANTEYLVLNTTAAKATGATRWNSTTPTSTVFSLGTDATVNANTGTYVAYLFAHDAGGFGAAGTDNVISCGEFTTDGSGNTPQVNLGFEPQYILYKRSNSTGSWCILDNMRGLNLTSSAGELVANIVDVEGDGPRLKVNATGFYDDAGGLSANATHIYMAIRRPMKPPTSGTQVFAPVAYTGTNVDNRLVDTGIVTDMVMIKERNDTVDGMVTGDRLRGNRYLLTGTTASENADADTLMTPTVGFGNAFSAMNGIGVGNDATSKVNIDTTSNNHIAWAFKRASKFFDIVCYTGTGTSGQSYTHNLNAVPEMMFVKSRNFSYNWAVYVAPLGNNKHLILSEGGPTEGGKWNNTTPTSTLFYLNGADDMVNVADRTFVAYLFASVNGVSKIGSYTGNGTSQTINCGFSAGARFVLIKRSDASGDWCAFDTTRGIVANSDPFIQLNLNAAEVTNEDAIDSDNSGFIVNTTTENINASGGTYIYLAIA